MLEPLAKDLWERSEPMKLRGIVPFEHRMTVARGASGALLLHSPVALTPELARELDGLGQVQCIVAPSLLHDLYLEPYLDRFSEAHFVAPPGMAASHPGLPVGGLLEDGLNGEWEDEFRLMKIDGMPRADEWVFLHSKTRTLIVADLIFNFGRVDSWITESLLRMAGTYGRPACSRLFRLLIKDRDAFLRSLAQLWDWDFDRVVPGHGKVLQSGGKPELRRIFSRL